MIREWATSGPCLLTPLVDQNWGPGCAPGEPQLIQCLVGEVEVSWIWMREQLDDGSWTPWVAVSTTGCDDDVALLAAIEREWTELVPAPSEVTLQPPGDTVYGTVPTIALAGTADRTHTATLLGTPVTIVATPVEYTWDWGDGEATTTTDPGRLYPDETVTHAYGHAVNEATVTLTTTWSGRWRAGSGAWNDFDDTVQSTSPGRTLTVLHPRAVLVG